MQQKLKTCCISCSFPNWAAHRQVPSVEEPLCRLCSEWEGDGGAGSAPSLRCWHDLCGCRQASRQQEALLLPRSPFSDLPARKRKARKATPSFASLLRAIPWLQHFHSDSRARGQVPTAVVASAKAITAPGVTAQNSLGNFPPAQLTPLAVRAAEAAACKQPRAMPGVPRTTRALGGANGRYKTLLPF